MNTKFSTSVILLLLFSCVAWTQDSDIYSFNFQSDDMTGWMIDNTIPVPDGLGTVWMRNPSFGMTATGYNPDTKVRFETNSMLYSPSIDLTGYSSAYWTFEHAFRYGSFDNISVWCNEGSGWKQLAIPNYPTGEDWNFVSSGSIDLSAFAGRIVKLGYRYSSTASIAGTWEIRQMNISGTPRDNMPANVLSVTEFVDLKSTSAVNSVRGIVQYVDNTTYGNFYLSDIDKPDTQIYIYGLLTEGGVSRKFYTLNVEQGDTLTLKGAYYLYTDPVTCSTKDEIVNAFYVSHSKAIVDSDWSDDLNGRWSAYTGQSYTFAKPMYICGFGGDNSLFVASSRLLCPEETGVGLPYDSIRYRERVRFNNSSRIQLNNVPDAKQYRLGSQIINLRVTIIGERLVQADGMLTIVPNERPTEPPALGNARLRLCGANVENYFYNWNGAYAGAQSAEQFDVQTEKISNALHTLNADIYALCEVENGQDALQHLVSGMNKLAGTNIYSYVNDGTVSSQSVKCAFVYRSDKVAPYGQMLHPYSNAGSIWYNREVIQGFRELATDEKMIVAINHLKAKSGAISYNEDRMTELGWLTDALQNVPSLYDDPDIIMFGDYNSYSEEEPIKYLVAQGFRDELHQRHPYDYSYVYNSTVGYLDHILTSMTMTKQVTEAAVWHVNADESNIHAYYNGDKSIYRYSDHDPVLVGLRLGEDVAAAIENTDGDKNGSAIRYVVAQPEELTLISAETVLVHIYTLTGYNIRSVRVHGTQTFYLPSGCYIIATPAHAYKCIIP